MKKTMISNSVADVIPCNEHELSAIHLPKSEIANIIKQRMNQKGTSIRKVSNVISNKISNFSYPQLVRVTNQENYNIETLLKVLYVLDLEIQIVPRIK